MSQKKRSARANPGITLSTELDPRLPVVRVPGLSDATLDRLELVRPTLLHFWSLAPALAGLFIPRPEAPHLPHRLLEPFSTPALLLAAEALRANLHRTWAALGLDPFDTREVSTTALLVAGCRPFPAQPAATRGVGPFDAFWRIVPRHTRAVPPRAPGAALINGACREMVCEWTCCYLWLEILARFDAQPATRALLSLYFGRTLTTQTLKRFTGAVIRQYRDRPKVERPAMAAWLDDAQGRILKLASQEVARLKAAGIDIFHAATSGQLDEEVLARINKKLDTYYQRRVRDPIHRARLRADPPPAVHVRIRRPDEELERKEWHERRVRALMAAAPDPKGRRLTLRILQDPEMTNRDLARDLGVSEATLYRRAPRDVLACLRAAAQAEPPEETRQPATRIPPKLRLSREHPTRRKSCPP